MRIIIIPGLCSRRNHDYEKITVDQEISEQVKGGTLHRSNNAGGSVPQGEGGEAISVLIITE